MKHHYLFSALALFAFACSTTDVEPEAIVTPKGEQPLSERYMSPDEAGKLAIAFMASLENDGTESRSERTRQVSDVSLLDTQGLSRSADSDTTFYVVNFEGGGYSLVAAERDLENSIYVYSPDGEFERTDNPVLDIYLENAIATMPDAPRRSNLFNNAHVVSRANKPVDPSIPITGEEYINGVLCKYIYKTSHVVKEPMLQTAWHQHKPYNMYCPVKNNLHTLVGCVAVAMGQICSYHRWPEQLDGRVYNWDEMLILSKHNDESSIGLNDVAHLLRNIGSLVGMKYGLESSGADIDDAESGFKKMGYNSATKKKYSTFECVHSLAWDRPVYMRGKTAKGEGHAWVVDGCDDVSNWVEYYRVDNGELFASYGGAGSTYLHFNAGWGGYKNAFYFCSIKGDNPEFPEFDCIKDYQIITDIKR